jgi:c-di-GMP-binding flagellar brake protein YcgR
MLRARTSERIEYVDPDDSRRELFDLSKGGACCLFDKQLDRGAIVKVQVETLELQARVSYSIQRTDGYRMGLQFWNITGAQQKHLDELVERFSRGVPVRCHVMPSQ